MRIFLSFVLLLLCSTTTFVKGQSQKPNIILILLDDVGYNTLKRLQFSLPNIDTLEKQGASFTQCYSSPSCSPSRHKILTGKSNARNYSRWSPMSRHNQTFANVLGANGYQTAAFGKWQLGGGDTSMRMFGFNTYLLWNALDPSSPWRGSRYKDPLLYYNGGFLSDTLVAGKYGEDIFADSLISFMEVNQANPFCIYYAPSLAHWPFQPTPDDPEYATWDIKKSDTVYYRSMIRYMDKLIGRINRKIDSLNLQNNTYVFFTSDNGTPRPIIDSTDTDGENGGKGTSTMSGTRVPLYVRGPGIAPMAEINDLIDFTDFLPTFASLSGIDTATLDKSLDGISFSGKLFGDTSTHRQWIFDYYKPQYLVTPLRRLAFTKTYKLYDYYGVEEFYNFAIDSNEMSPLVDSMLTQQEIDIRDMLRGVLNFYAKLSSPVANDTRVSNITDTSAYVSTTITNIGGYTSVTERGTVLASGPSPYFRNLLIEGDTAIGIYGHTRTNLTPQTQYWTAGYIRKDTLSNCSPPVTFWTLSRGVASSPSSLQAFGGSDMVTVKWNHAVFPVTDATKGGYLLIYSATGQPALINNPDGNDPTAVSPTGTVIDLSSRLPALPTDFVNIRSLQQGIEYHFLLVAYTWDGFHASTYNYDTVGILTASVITGQNRYTWNGSSLGNWNQANNWLPQKVPADGDQVCFRKNTNATITNIPSANLSTMQVEDSAVVRFQASGSRSVNLTKLGDSSLYVGRGASLSLEGSASLSIQLLNGCKGEVYGSVSLSGAGHRIIVNDSLGFIFRSGAQMTAGDLSKPGFSGNPFGRTGRQNTVVFEAGSSYVQVEGLSPFGLSAPASKVLFDPLSNYFVRTGTAVPAALSGRTLGSLFVEKGSIVNDGGSRDFRVRSLKIDSSSAFRYVTSGLGSIFVTGDITHDGNDTLLLNVSRGDIFFDANGAQSISGRGPISFSHMNIPVGDTVNLLCNITNTIRSDVRGRLNCRNSVISGNGAFTLLPGASLAAGSAEGINATIMAGNIQTLTRNFHSSASYIFDATGDQVTGDFTTSPRRDTIASVTFAATGTIRLTKSMTVVPASGSTAALVLAGGLVDLNGWDLVLTDNSIITGAGGNFSGTTGRLVFPGRGKVNGPVVFSHVTIGKTVDFGANSTIGQSLQINNGGMVSPNPVTYAPGSWLIYSTGGTYKRNNEWSATAGRGYPHNVLIRAATTVDVSANGFAARSIAGDLMLGDSVTPGSLSMGALPNSLTVGGNIQIGSNVGNSRLILSSAGGGDLVLMGNWGRSINGTFDAKSRSVLLTGNRTQTISGPGDERIPGLRVQKTGGAVQLASTVICSRLLSIEQGNIANINTGNYRLLLDNGATKSLVRLGQGHIIGTFSRAIATGTQVGYLFPVGTNAGYTPATVTFSTVSSAGYLSATSVDGDPAIQSPYINYQRSVNRYWAFSAQNIAFNDYRVRLTFLSTDRDPGFNISSAIVGRLSNGTWSFPNVGTRNSAFIDASGNQSFGDFSIGAPGCVTPDVTASITTPLCNGTATGGIMVTLQNGTGPFSFAWTGPNNFISNSQSVSNIPAGSYELVITANGGCTQANTYLIAEPPPLSFTISQTGNNPCDQADSVLLTVSANGGVQPYLYSISTGGTQSAFGTDSVFKVGSGTFFFTVSDSVNCTTTDVFTVTNNCQARKAIEGKTAPSFNVSIYPNPARDAVNYQVVGSTETVVVTLFNALGQLMFSTKANPGNSRLDLGSFPAGLYYLHFRQGGSSRLVHLLKK